MPPKKKFIITPILSPKGNPPVCTVIPVISGSLSVGSILTCTQGTWKNNTTSTLQFLFQWQRNLADIKGAVDPTYIIQNADIGANITCLVTAYNSDGGGYGRSLPVIPTIGAGGPPNLTSATATATGTTTANLGVATDQSAGTLYWIVSTSATPPSSAQIILGKDSSGASAATSGSQTVSVSGAQSASATGLTASTSYYAYFMHVNILQSSVASASFSTNGVLDAPVLSRTSSAGASPLQMTAALDSTVAAGNSIEVQIATDSGFVTITQDITQLIDGSSWEAGDLTLTGFNTPAANVQYWARCRVVRDDGIASPWSNVITDTIVATTTVLDNSKRCTNNAIIQTSPLYGASLQLTGADQIAEQCAGTSNSVPIGGKFYSEHKVTGIQYGSSGVGIADGTFVWATSLGSAPPATNKGAGLNRSRSIVPSGSTTMGVESLNDFVQMCVKRTSATSVTVWIGKNNSWVNGDPSAETGGETVTLNDEGGGVYHCFGYVFVLGATDVIQSNFGQAAFNYTKPTGATAWN